MTLTDFLTARIDDDERLARAAAGSAAPAEEGADVALVARFGPSRVLVECAAKRRLVELADEATGYDMTVDLERASSARADSKVAFVGDRILEVLALPYADHPDYDASWRPAG